ncbi:hypothetical protein [Williamsia phyllosphaerae]|uniref:Uncharacterized protein n=1 Tax=Williamsia phyllosphaerae TaxID=885042 RepID=A0ABQ1U7X8_9NOCA|nr:hypothetical protein [Williamsia phyllosphaerae]GGF11317.1 hypothetical protein GCM10007298_04140 [Williamsia phyllosphaerae]
MSTTTATRSSIRTLGGFAVLAGAGSILSIISLIGPTWLFSPAQPAAGVPEMSLDFATLGDITASSPSTVQSSYFGWLGWTLVIVTIAAAAAAIVTRIRLLAAAEGVIALVALVVTVFAVKGPLSWGGFYDAIPNMRIGGYLITIGLVLIIAHAAGTSRRSRA